jgi:2-haloacid dehalogenase
LTEVFDHVLSADSVRRFKTAPEVYALAPAAYGAPAEELLFVSSNCWDACGAAWYGYQSFWINRQNAKEDVLDAKLTATGSSMSDVVRWIDDRRA